MESITSAWHSIDWLAAHVFTTTTTMAKIAISSMLFSRKQWKKDFDWKKGRYLIGMDESSLKGFPKT